MLGLVFNDIYTYHNLRTWGHLGWPAPQDQRQLLEPAWGHHPLPLEADPVQCSSASTLGQMKRACFGGSWDICHRTSDQRSVGDEKSAKQAQIKNCAKKHEKHNSGKDALRI